MSFDFIVSEVYPTLATGGALVLRSDEMVTSTQAFLEFIIQTEVSVIQFTTAFWHELVTGLDRLGQALPPTLRLLLFRGEKASLRLCKQWVETIGHYPRLFNAYGPTETTVITTLYDAVAEQYDGTHDLPIGRAIRNAQTYVLDEHLQPVAPGETGELHIGGPGVTLGYLNLPEKTNRVFVDSPFHAGERLYKTGDLVRMDDSGLIEFVGRVDFQVKIRGFRIELGEIEACLDSYPAIQHRIVVARADETNGKVAADKKLVAYVVMKPGQVLDRQDLKQFLQAQLPTFMMPSAIVVMPALPKNGNGKIDRKALPVPSQTDLQRTLVPPRTPLEEQLVDLWKSVLSADSVGITDNFFDIGGHSLLVMRLFSELEARFNQRLPLVEIFAAPTVEQMAERLDQLMVTPSMAPTSAGDADARQSNLQHNSLANNNFLTTLKLGDAPPLFLVYEANGDTGLYIHLVRRLTHHLTVYGIRPKSKGDMPLVHSRITEMAQHCIAQMKQAQPTGPYLIGGLCVGGVIASEVVLQLERAGEQAALILLDSPEPTLENREGDITDGRKGRMAQILASGDVREILRQSWRKGTNLVRYEVTDKAERLNNCARGHLFRWWQDGSFAGKGWPMPKLLRPASAFQTIAFAYNTYRPSGQIAGPVLLVRATEGDGTQADQPYFKLSGEPLLGWGDRTQNPIQVCDVPGGHSTMLSDRHSQSLAKTIDAFLDSALEELH